MGWDVLHAIRDHQFGSASAKAVMLALASYTDAEWSAFAGQKLLADECELSEKTVWTVLRDLESRGLIVRQRRYRQDGTRTSDRILLVESAINALPVVPSRRPKSDHDLPVAVAGSDDDPPTDLPVTDGDPTRNSRKTLPVTVTAQEQPVELPVEQPEEIQHDACEATLPATIESSLPARRRVPDQLFESLVAVCHGTDDWSRLTGPERGVLNRAVKELKAVDATPAEVADRARAYVAWLGQRPTPVALVKHWNRLADPVQRLPRHELDALAEEQALAARMAEAERRERERLADEAARSAVTSDRQLGDGHPPPAWLSDQYPREDGESVRDYIRRLNAMTKEAG